MRTVVIGGTGHIGSYLVPRLVAAGHHVMVLSRGERAPYHEDPAWRAVERHAFDRRREAAAGTLGRAVAALRADAVIDLICFEPESCRLLVEALAGRIGHFLHCGTLWVHGAPEIVPAPESAPRRPFGDYGIRKAAIEAYLLEQARRHGFPATILHPGHIVGEGWAPINPAGNLEPGVFERLARGEPVALPDRGLATLHHVHADDVAQGFERALDRRAEAVGEAFHVVSPAAVTLLGYAREVARWFGREAVLRFLPWEEWRAQAEPASARLTEDHIAHAPCASIEKARRHLGYEPRYTSCAAVREAPAGSPRRCRRGVRRLRLREPALPDGPAPDGPAPGGRLPGRGRAQGATAWNRSVVSFSTIWESDHPLSKSSSGRSLES
jgi:nucleoside-diphosphate-sugar epimerase